MAQQPKHVFQIESIEAHCRKVQAEAAAAGTQPDWNRIWKTDGAPNDSANCLWWTVLATDINGVTAPFNFTFSGRQQGGVEPATQEGLVEFNQWRAAYKAQPLTEIRTQKPPTVNLTLYDGKVESVDNDGVTPKTDAAGNPVLPEKQNPVGYVAWCFNAWVVPMLQTAIQNGTIVQNGQGVVLAPGQIPASNMKVVSPVQTHISYRAKRNANKPLLNPIVRMKIRVGKDGSVDATILDQTKPIGDPKNPSDYEVLSDQGSPFNNFNAHRLLKSGATVTGIARADSICFSNMGISAPFAVELAIIHPPVFKANKFGMADLLGTGFSLPAPQVIASPVEDVPPQAPADDAYVADAQNPLMVAPQQFAPAPQAPPQQYAPPQAPPQQYAPPQDASPQAAPAPQQYAPPQAAPAPQAPPQQYAPPQNAAPQAPPQQYAPPQDAPPQAAPAPQVPPQQYAPPQDASPQAAPAPQVPPQQYAPPQAAPAPQAPPQQYALPGAAPPAVPNFQTMVNQI